MQRVLDIVSTMHALDIVHLDLSPSKFVFFAGNLKLVGLGNCLRLGVEVHPRSYVPLYASPELRECADKREKLRAARSLDVWSVGIMLCQLLTCSSFRAEDFCRAGSQPGWHEHFFMEAEANSPNGDVVSLIRTALCNTEPHLRFDCCDLAQHEQ
jgi:serine/threonine protein kinase